MCKASNLVNCGLHCGWVTSSPVQTVVSAEQHSHCGKKSQKKPTKQKTNTNPQTTTTNKTKKINQTNKQKPKHTPTPPELESTLQNLIVSAFQNEEKLGSRQVPNIVYNFK